MWRQSIMSRAKYLLLSAISALAFVAGTPAMALNPQPLPPGIHLVPNCLCLSPLPPRQNWNRAAILRCHGVQVGDPRKQSPMRVCP